MKLHSNSAEKVNINHNISRQLSDVRDDDVSAEIDICLTFDRNFIPHAAVTLLSATRAIGKRCQLNVHVICSGDISDEEHHAFESLSPHAKITWYEVDTSRFESLPDNREHISLATYIRLLIPETLCPVVQKVIYLDCDTILTDRLYDLWSTNLDGAQIAAAPDEGGQTHAKRLKLIDSSFYFNAGVLVFNLEAIDSNWFAEEVARVVARDDVDLHLQDQDILNLLFEARAHKLDLRWNANTRLYTPNDLRPAYTPIEAEAAMLFPGILHFTDRRKPWTENCNHPLRDLYWELRNQTLWRETLSQQLLRNIKDQLRNRFSKSRRLVNMNY